VVAKQGYLAPQDHSGAGSQVASSYCRSLHALASMFPPKLSSHTSLCVAGLERLASIATRRPRVCSSRRALTPLAASPRRSPRSRSLPRPPRNHPQPSAGSLRVECGDWILDAARWPRSHYSLSLSLSLYSRLVYVRVPALAPPRRLHVDVLQQDVTARRRIRAQKLRPPPTLSHWRCSASRRGRG
jgi:hypothetical protein